MTGMMTLRQLVIAGTLLIAVGVYQLTSLKENCLAHCRPRASLLRIGGRAWPAPGAIGLFAWRLLRGVLLCPDAASLRGRRDEFGLDRRLDPARARRKALARKVGVFACSSESC
jgi:predicted metal-binding integral membrane protein DUF2182